MVIQGDICTISGLVSCGHASIAPVVLESLTKNHLLANMSVDLLLISAVRCTQFSA